MFYQNSYIRSICLAFIIEFLTVNLSLSITVPEGYIIFSEIDGAKTYGSTDGANYVHAIYLNSGASVKLLTGRIDKNNDNEPNPKFYQDPLRKFIEKQTEENKNIYLITNGTFFDRSSNPSSLAFSLKIDGIEIATGYEGRWKNDLLLLELWDNHVDIVPEVLPYRSVFHNSSAPNIIGGLTETTDCGSRPNEAIERTFAGVADFSDGFFRTLLILNSKRATQKNASTILGSFGASKVIMFDGGGSTQLLIQTKDIITSDRLIPQAIAIIASRKENMAEVLNFERTADPICSGIESDVQNPNFTISFSIINKSEYTVLIDEISVSIHDFLTNQLLWNMFDPITGIPKIIKNITLSKDDVYDFGKAASYFKKHGDFIFNINVKINAESTVIKSMSFSVIPTYNNFNPAEKYPMKLGKLSVPNGTKIYSKIAEKEIREGNIITPKGYPVGEPIDILTSYEKYHLLRLIPNCSESVYTLKIETEYGLTGYILRPDRIGFTPDNNDLSKIIYLYYSEPYEYEGDIEVVDKRIDQYEQFINKYPCSVFVPNALLSIINLNYYTLQYGISKENKIGRYNKIADIIEKLGSKFILSQVQKEKIEEFRNLLMEKREKLCSSVNLSTDFKNLDLQIEFRNTWDKLGELYPLFPRALDVER